MFEWLSQQFEKVKKKTGQSQSRKSNDVMVQDKGPQQSSSDSLRLLLKAAIADADQIAGSIKMKAQMEAKAEAARIIAEAKLEAEEMKAKAEIAAQKEAEEIISAANRKAEITEVEVKHKALEFLIRTGQEVEKKIGEDYKRAYSRLSASLQSLMDEGQNIETELKSRAAKLWEGKIFEIKGYEDTLLSISEGAVPTIEALASAETELKTDVATEEKGKKPRQLKEKTRRKTRKSTKAKKTQKQAKKVAEPAQLQEEAPEEKVTGPLKLQEKIRRNIKKITTPRKAQKQAKKKAELAATGEEIPKEKVAEPAQLREEAPEEKIAEPLKLQEEAQEEKVAEPLKLKEKAPEEKIEVPASRRPDSHTLYTGEVELTTAAPVELKLVSRLYNYLQTVPELRILYTRGSWDQGTTITVVLEKAMPLISILSEVPSVEVIPELLDKDSPAKGQSSLSLRGTEKRVGEIKLHLKERKPTG